MSGRPLILLAIGLATPLAARPLELTKSSVVVADPVDLLVPRAIPGATIEYAIRVDNPGGLLSGQPVAAVEVTDTIAATLALQVAGPASGGGPVAFEDGSLLGLGLLGSGLGYRFGGLAAADDGIDFFDGAHWGYVPVPDASGFDARVRAIRVRLTGTQAPGSTFRLRFRVKLL